MHHITRREFVHRAALTAAGLPFVRQRTTRRAPIVLRIAVVESTGSPNVSRQQGIEIGSEEATHSAALFGGSVAVDHLKALPTGAAMWAAVIGGASLDESRTLAQWAAAERIPFINIGCTNDELRAGSCARPMFHVVPSDAMNRDARRMANASDDAPVVAWDPSLDRFGADTLNERFRTRFNAPMTSEAWTAWLAIKILSESALRARSAQPSTLISYLDRDATQFDGHKGQPLSFRAWDHQLRQPLYVTSSPRLVEVPLGGASDVPARGRLDQLGTPAKESTCRLGA